MIRQLLILLAFLVLGLQFSCLENLNQTQYFRKLYKADADLYVLVVKHRLSIEKQADTYLREQLEKDPDDITYWGEGIGPLNKEVMSSGGLIMTGKISYSDEAPMIYVLECQVDESGQANFSNFHFAPW